MNILVVGSGGREHAIVWKLRQSQKLRQIFCAPGNAGIEELATLVPLKPTDLQGLLEFAQERKIDLTVVGPEQPLVHGIVDLFEKHGLKIFGPRKGAALLEGSKVFAKNFMERNKIPTARFRSFSADEKEKAFAFIEELNLPLVVKADGIAAGKGVVICQTKREAHDALREMMVEMVFGSAGEHVVIEEFLEGEEASLFAVSDGEKYVMLAAAQDHKRILDGDLGKNTGGMGAYAPAPGVTPELRSRVEREIIVPTLGGMRQEGTPYAGCLYIGLMITKQGPKVLEYNCRFGDPEAQVVIPLIESDFIELLWSVAERRLDLNSVKPRAASAVCVVVASQGYPDEYQTGKRILGLEKINPDEGVVVFHAGTRKDGDHLVTSGGRVLGVTAVGSDQDLQSTILDAYRAVEKITFDGAYYRSDIGKKALRGIAPLPLSTTPRPQGEGI